MKNIISKKRTRNGLKNCLEPRSLIGEEQCTSSMPINVDNQAESPKKIDSPGAGTSLANGDSSSNTHQSSLAPYSDNDNKTKVNK